MLQAKFHRNVDGRLYLNLDASMGEDIADLDEFANRVDDEQLIELCRMKRGGRHVTSLTIGTRTRPAKAAAPSVALSVAVGLFAVIGLLTTVWAVIGVL